MKAITLMLLMLYAEFPEKRYAPDFFVRKHDLNLPKVTEEMLDASKHTHASDSWYYFYQGKTNRVDSVYRRLNIQGFPPNGTHDKYAYRGDSVVVHSASVAETSGDTTTHYLISHTNDFRTTVYQRLKTGCHIYVHYASWGKRISEKVQCPSDPEPAGQEFELIDRGEYLESIETYKGEIDSNTIRRYYFSPFDSLVADYMVRRDKEPFLVRLRFYGRDHKQKLEYGFGIFSNINEVVDFDYRTYTAEGRPHRVYHFAAKDTWAESMEYELSNYTEYTYDSLGRKRTVITRVVPEPEEQ
jgi:hypothetical protein